jgi:hypothetical protein
MGESRVGGVMTVCIRDPDVEKARMDFEVVNLDPDRADSGRFRPESVDGMLRNTQLAPEGGSSW